MPVYSMTGYACLHSSYAESGNEEKGARPQGTLQTLPLTLEVRSVNSRFLDVTLKLCEELRPLEAPLRELLQKRLRRGKVELRAQLEFARAGAEASGPPQAAILQKLGSLQDSILAWMPHAAPLSVAEVMHMAAAPKPTVDTQTLHLWVLEQAQHLIADLQAARQTEGAQLRTSLLERIGQLRALAARAAPLIPQLVTQQRQRFVEKWQEAMQLAGSGGISAQTAHDRALAEATAFALRIDVAEELVRLQAHLDTIENLLAQGGELGKRLDFLIQELHREANTLGSKSATLETSHISVDMKVLIEQMREQVQNIE